MEERGPNYKVMAVIRIRGLIDARPEVRKTMEMLHLKRKFRATLVPHEPAQLGMLHRIKDYSTFGEIDLNTLTLLLRNRGELKEGGRLTDKWLAENTEFKSVEELAEAILDGKIKFHKISWLKPYFRLHPPKKGFKRSTKRPWRDKGELGYRGAYINELLRRMI
ncbi:MAG TPA: 50S ribosomal protein L30 [Candidatus Korarchaeota archaeon]|nr:50S ribosomal protein L30 [Candidatus Korarchaeota archaeon]